MSEPGEVTTMSGLVVPLKLSVNYISFSAHSDFMQTSEFIDTLHPPYVVRHLFHPPKQKESLKFARSLCMEMQMRWVD